LVSTKNRLFFCLVTENGTIFFTKNENFFNGTVGAFSSDILKSKTIEILKRYGSRFLTSFLKSYFYSCNGTLNDYVSFLIRNRLSYRCLFLKTINLMCGTIRGQHYRFTVKTKIFRDFVKNRKKRYVTPRGWAFFLYRKTIGCGMVRYGHRKRKNSISLLYYTLILKQKL